MNLFLMGGVIVVVVALLLYALLARGSFYVNRRNGFSAYSAGPQRITHIATDKLHKAMEMLVAGEPFDGLWVSNVDDGYQGLVLGLAADHIELDAGFYHLKEQEKLENFRVVLAALGYEPMEESVGNAGLGADWETKNLEYHLPLDPPVLDEITRAALENLQGPASEGVFVKAWRTEDRPSKPGIYYLPNKDLLRELRS